MLYASVDLRNASISWNSAPPPPPNIGRVLKHR